MALSNIDKVKQCEIVFKVSLFRHKKKISRRRSFPFDLNFFPKTTQCNFKKIVISCHVTSRWDLLRAILDGSFGSVACLPPFRSGESDFNVQVFVFRVITPKVRRSAEMLLSAERSVFFRPHSTRGFQGNALCMALLGNNKVLTSLCNGGMCKSSTRGRLFFREDDKNKCLPLSLVGCLSARCICLFVEGQIWFLCPCSHCLSFTPNFKVVESFFFFFPPELFLYFP